MSRRILVIRLRLIGDVVFTTPLLRALRRQDPDAHLAYVVEPAAAPILSRNPHLNEIIRVPAPKGTGLARLRDDWDAAAMLRRMKFDVAIDLHGGPRGAWLAWASRAPMRIGYTMPGRSWMYTHAVARPADTGSRHSVSKQWDLLAPLGIPAGDPIEDPVEIAEDPDAAAAVGRRLAHVGISSAHPLIIVHVSAGNPFRRWPEESFAELVTELVRRDDRRRVVLTSGPSDADAARTVAQRARAVLGPLGRAVPEIEEFNLPELRSLIARAAVYIGGDSGPLHIAATTTTPIVALLGPTLAGRSLPWRDPRWFAEAVEIEGLPCRPCRQRTCAPGDFRCLTGIGADRVVAAAERALASVSRTWPSRASAPHAAQKEVQHA